MDYYETLGVDKNATEEDIKKAYRALAQKYHPDRAHGDEKRFKQINEAYRILSNRERRAQYDRFGRTFSAGDGAPGWDPFGFSAKGGPASGWDMNFENMGADFGDLGDLFESFFGTNKKRRTYTRGSDIQIDQPITLEESYAGARKEIKFEVLISCKECAGKGYFADAGTKKCETCNGRGEVKEVRNTFFGSFQQVKVCSKCFGVGEIPNKICTVCKGSGRRKQSRAITVDILAGVSDGQLIKIAGAGEAGERGAATGDLYVQVRVKPHKIFSREGENLVMKKEISAVNLLLDREIEIETIGGEIIKVEIPAGFKISDRLRVAGYGLPRLNRRGFGDLFIELELITPRRLSAKAKKLLEELRGELE